jgi:hypothetical protein
MFVSKTKNSFDEKSGNPFPGPSCRLTQLPINDHVFPFSLASNDNHILFRKRKVPEKCFLNNAEPETFHSMTRSFLF